jgi:hypothetical protein
VAFITLGMMVNLDQREGPLPPLDAAAHMNEVEEDDHDDLPEDEDEEEEDISVCQKNF